jgi:hypothetical protein
MKNMKVDNLQLKSEMKVLLLENQQFRKVTQTYQVKTQSLKCRIEEYKVDPPVSQIDYKILNNRNEMA